MRQNDPQCQRRVVLRLHLSAASRWEADVTTLHRGWFESKFLVRNSSDQLQKWSCEVWSCLLAPSQLLFEEKPFAEVYGNRDYSVRRLLGSNCSFLAICWIKLKGKWKTFSKFIHTFFTWTLKRLQISRRDSSRIEEYVSSARHYWRRHVYACSRGRTWNCVDKLLTRHFWRVKQINAWTPKGKHGHIQAGWRNRSLKKMCTTRNIHSFDPPS